MGKVKQYLIWHASVFGTEPANWEHLDEYLVERHGRIPLAIYEPTDFADNRVISDIRTYSPCIDLILKIQRSECNLYHVHWREFEKVVAELLHSDGWDVDLQQGIRNGGVDILAKKSGLPCGDVLTLWQAKRYGEGRKVGIGTVRELADTRNEFKASKGIIVTSSYLTDGAIKRVNVTRTYSARWIATISQSGFENTNRDSGITGLLHERARD